MANLIACDVSTLKALGILNPLGNFHNHLVADRPTLYSGLYAGHHFESVKRLFATAGHEKVLIGKCVAAYKAVGERLGVLAGAKN